MDYHRKPLGASIPSFVKDTNDFLHKLADIETLLGGAIMFSIDVVGLYPHIPHNEGLDAIRHAPHGRQNQEIPTSLIAHLAELVLKNNNFEFNAIQY